MSLNPLTPVTDYQSMLNRIFWFTSAAALLAVWLLRENLPPVREVLSAIDFRLELEGERILPVPGGYLVPALAIGLVSRVFRIHSVVANWLGIRERFEVDVIIHELAYRTGVSLDDVPDEELVRRRYHIMRHGFYQFVSGRRPQIDELLVERALDTWSWFWIVLEAAVVLVLTGFVLIACGVEQTGITVVLASLALSAAGLPTIRSQCRRYAVAQVRAIVDDSERARLVREAFHGLETDRPTIRRAA